MDLVAEMLARELRANHAGEFDVTMLQPDFKRRFTRVPIIGRSNRVMMADRLLNRLRDYPRWLSGRADDFDLFHIADHSYSQLVHVLPPDRVGVFCHDLDTFRCLLDSSAELRPRWFRAMARKILEGMQKARVVFHSTIAVRQQILEHGLIDPAKLVHAPFGIATEFTRDATNVPLPPQLAGAINHGFVLHVGSCIQRKRVDVLLDVFAKVSRCHPELHLIQIGGSWTAGQLAQIRRLGIGPRVIQRSGQPRAVIAELYRRCRALLLTSQAEGFGLPVVEGLACGAIVLASDIPALREVGSDAALYCPVADVGAWSSRLDRILSGTEVPPPLELRLKQAARLSWADHAGIIADTYLRFD